MIAAALILAGVVLAGFARERVDRLTYQLDLPIPLGRSRTRRYWPSSS